MAKSDAQAREAAKARFEAGMQKATAPDAKTAAPAPEKPAEDKSKPKPGPVNSKTNMPIDPTPKAQPKGDADQKPSSALGDLLNLGGVTKDAIEQAKGKQPPTDSARDKFKAAQREFKEGDKRAQETKSRMKKPPKDEPGRDR